MAPTTLPQMLSLCHGETQEAHLAFCCVVWGQWPSQSLLEMNQVGKAPTHHDRADTPCGFTGLPKTGRHGDEEEVERRNGWEAPWTKRPDVGHNAGKGQGQEEGL